MAPFTFGLLILSVSHQSKPINGQSARDGAVISHCVSIPMTMLILGCSRPVAVKAIRRLWPESGNAHPYPVVQPLMRWV